jgi:tetratricopeptide (TPR) repeat protein
MNSAAQVMEQGWQSFQQGDAARAEQIANHAVSLDANSADAWFLLAMSRHVRGDGASALSCYERVCQLAPEHTGPLNNLGVLYASFGRHHEAIAVLATLLRARPDDPVPLGNYANSLSALGRFEEAERHYRRALDLAPDHFDALVNYGALLINHKQTERAIPILARASRIQPDSYLVNNNLGLAYLNLGDDAAAERHLTRALQLDPHSFEALTNFGNLCARRKDFESAVAYHRQAVRVQPNNPKALDNLGLALQDTSHYHEALPYFRRALEIHPDAALTHANLGRTLTELCRFTEGETHLREALRLQPDCSHAHNVLGLIHFHRGEDEASLRCFDEALRHDPELDRCRVNRAFLRLRQGDFELGWPEYELRFKTDDLNLAPCPAPRWDGADLPGKTIVVRFEQGRGDLLQFVRYLPRVRAKASRVILEAPACLHPILSRCAGFDVLHAMGEPLPPADAQVSIMSLPFVLGSIDAPVPYLEADPALVESWDRELQSVEGFKIAIAWQGDTAFRFDPLRSIPLEHFEAIAKVPGVRLISVQKHVGLDQIAANLGRVPLLDFGHRLDEASGPFMDTAAIMKNVDLVITSDTATAHLAGGLGVPTWLAVHYAPDWRWFLKREDSPWYPTMRLFRQTEPGDWGGVFARLADAVRVEIARREAPAPDASLRSAFYVPTSPGELLDKFSILQIKSERLTNAEQIRNVRTEIRLLERLRDRILAGSQDLSEFAEQLKKVNEALWQVEEDLRSCERAKDFGPRFIELARSVYKHNDRRAALKRKINLSLRSPLTEEKDYALSGKG